MVGARPGDEGELAGIELEDVRSGGREQREVQGLFLLLGASPHCAWLPSEIATDAKGFVLTGRDAAEEGLGGTAPGGLETSVPGVYCAGDVRAGSMKRVASATGEGAAVVSLIHERPARLDAPA